MKRLLLAAVLFSFCFESFSQIYRYTEPLFPTSDITTNVIYGTAPFLNSLYTDENNTTVGDLVMDLYEGTGDTCANRPAIIFVHGGGFITGNRNHNDMVAFCDSFAKMGYVTATIDYRQGFDLILNAEMHSTRAAYRGLQDGRAAVRYIRANALALGINPDHIYMVGSSAGAFVGLHAIYMDKPGEKPVDAGVVNYINLTFPFSHNTPDLGPVDVGNNLAFNGEPNALVSMWGAVNDTSLIEPDNDEAVLLIHGSADGTVPFIEGAPFGYPLLPDVQGSKLINDRLNNINLTDKETYFVTGEDHEFYGVGNGTWSNGTNGNAYWDTILYKSEQFLWQVNKPDASFSMAATLLDVNYTDLSTGANSWVWDFGDGASSTLQNPAHSYAVGGTYTVMLYIGNELCSWDTLYQNISVVPCYDSYANISPIVCNSYTSPSGLYTLSTSQLFNDTIPNVAGCDSIISIDLTINYSDTSYATLIACDSYFWNGTNYTLTGNYSFLATTSSGCDSTANLDLTINNSTSSNTIITACNDYFWNGTTYTATGNYSLVTTNAVGCDSTANLNLTINYSDTSFAVLSSCDSLLWNGTVYYTSGNFAFNTFTSLGCDSISYLSLTVHSTSFSIAADTSCDSYVWNGSTYSTSGTYTFTTQNMVGCDSTITLTLTILNSTISTTDITACESYLWNAVTYTSSGSYSIVTTNSVGCDSTATLNLTINLNSNSSDTALACTSYLWNGNTYSTSGTYTYNTINTAGCDSVAELNLTISPINTNVSQNGITLEATTPGLSYQWMDCNTQLAISGATDALFTAPYNGDFAVILTAPDCSDTSACYTIVGVGLSTYNTLTNVLLYPNPSAGHFTIDLGTTYQSVQLSLISITGQLLWEKAEYEAAEIILDLELQSGVYYLQITTEAGQHTLEVLLQ